MFKRMSELFSAMKQLQGMSGMANEVAERLNQERVVGHAGGGMVEAEMTGSGHLLRVRIAPELISKGDHEIVEDLVTAAVRQATEKAQQCSTKILQEMASELPLGNLSGLFEQMGMGDLSADSSDDDDEASPQVC